MHTSLIFPSGFTKRTQRGSALVLGLMFLVVLLMLTVGIMMSNSLETRMAGNSSDYNMAFQAAESALRDAEVDVLRNLGAASAFDTSCTSGLCLPAVSGAPVWKTITWSSAAVTRNFGAFTAAPPLVGVGRPKYIVERMAQLPPPFGESMSLRGPQSTGGVGHRITARASGTSPDTVVQLQAVVAKRD